VNSILLIGHLGADPETRTTQSGSTVTKFRLATERFNGPDREKTTDWHSVTCFGKLAENCAKYLAKGRAAAVRGSVRYSKWDTPDGTTKWFTEILAEEVKFLGGGNGGGGAKDGGDYQPEAVSEDGFPF